MGGTLRPHQAVDEVLDLDGIADGEDVRIARARVLIYADAATCADLHASHSCERSVGTHAERENHERDGKKQGSEDYTPRPALLRTRLGFVVVLRGRLAKIGRAIRPEGSW